MIDWTVKEAVWAEENITANGNKFLTGNGYMGIRGTLEEFDKEQFTAINLAGTYDQVGNAFREPLNAPNGMYTCILVQDETAALPSGKESGHSISLDYRYGIFSRKTVFDTKPGRITVTGERFASMDQKHLIAMKYCIKADFAGTITLVTGIDGDVWDLNGPHYDKTDFQYHNQNHEDMIEAASLTHENQDTVLVLETMAAQWDYDNIMVQEENKMLRKIPVPVEPGKEYCLIKYISVFTSKDTNNYYADSIKVIEDAKSKGYEGVLTEHKQAWDRLWNLSYVEIEGDDKAMEALNYSIYHLHCIAPRHSDSLSIAARGLSGQTYKGAVFWDTEMFMLDFFLYTEPSVARTLLKYRVDTLDGARRKAASYGLKGAFYPWESQEGGYDACSDYNVVDVFTKRPMRTFFKDKQIHISAAVVYGIMSYTGFTNDNSLIEEGGWRVILECALFYYDLLVKKVHLDQFELHDVVGPDEYHERVNNNGYTNRMAQFTFKAAAEVIEKIPGYPEDVRREAEQAGSLDEMLYKFRDAAEKIYIPKPDPETGVIDQFDGYMELEDISVEDVRNRMLDNREYWGGAYGVASWTRVIKQADVVTWLSLFPGDFEPAVLEKNWEYYETRTEHGSSLSACMYALLACRLGMPDRAYPFFMKSAGTDMSGKSKEWAGLVYIGGTHPASAGGAYMTAVKGFAGISAENGELVANPHLPAGWKKMKFHIIYRKQIYEIIIEGRASRIVCIGNIT